jgi:thioredoxin-like negative regulator of GroEL
MLSPIIEEVAGEVDGVKVGKLNVDENPQVASLISDNEYSNSNAF